MYDIGRYAETKKLGLATVIKDDDGVSLMVITFDPFTGKQVDKTNVKLNVIEIKNFLTTLSKQIMSIKELVDDINALTEEVGP